MTVTELRAAGKYVAPEVPDYLKVGTSDPLPTRIIYRHKRCKATVAVRAMRRTVYTVEPFILPYRGARQGTRTEFEVGGRWMKSLPSEPCPTCAAPMYGDAVHGRYSATRKCDPRCTGATGFDCECQCGGKNHGADHETEGAA